MNKEQKGKTVGEIAGLVRTAKVVVLSDFTGLDVEGMTRLRRGVRQAKGMLRVVKNSLSLRALSDPPYRSLHDFLTGPNALAISSADPVEVVKKLMEFAKDHPRLKVKGGVMEGSAVSAEQLSQIAKLPGRDVLFAQLMAALDAPLSGLLCVLQTNVSSFLVLLKGIEEKKAKGEPAASEGGQG